MGTVWTRGVMVHSRRGRAFPVHVSVPRGRCGPLVTVEKSAGLVRLTLALKGSGPTNSRQGGGGARIVAANGEN